MFKKILFVLIFVILKFIESKRFQIVGGSSTLIAQFPFLGVYYSNNNFVCACSLVSHSYAISAAHCTFYYPWQITIRFGSSYRDREGVMVNVTNYIQHPNFDITNYNNDISILNFSKALKYSSHIRPIKLPFYDKNNLKIGTNVKIAGWGMMSYYSNDLPPQQLYSTTVKVSDFDSCSTNYSTQFQELTENMLCASAYNKDACLGDSGGPLVFNETLHGIISFGFGCGMEFYPGIYTKVSMFLPWLKENLPLLSIQ
ncbi:hypothetical protein PVAND_004222 [Polypedilum vanderplanki]|uniref:Peptidase S1 domain-containing protein n=1 Tax=Polypedilum vanderplanki TaxID=319348 RepID=A0A9J6BWX1_POLVA|nr:hypothetical protein PVAND_004222 [Polypedilum vanderplanki]